MNILVQSTKERLFLAWMSSATLQTVFFCLFLHTQIALAVGVLIVSIVSGFFVVRQPFEKASALVVLYFLLVCSLILYLRNTLEPSVFFSYGDTNTLGKLLEAKAVLYRWYAGSSILSKVYALFVPSGISSTRFIQVSGYLCSAVLVSWICYRAKPSKRLLLVAPVLILIGSGYQEYYPFIVALLVLFLIFTDHSLEQRPSGYYGFYTAFVFWSYVGFMPLVGLSFLLILWKWRTVAKNYVAAFALGFFLLPLLLTNE